MLVVHLLYRQALNIYRTACSPPQSIKHTPIPTKPPQSLTSPPLSLNPPIYRAVTPSENPVPPPFPLHPPPSLLPLRHRLPRLRTYLQHAADLVQQRLVLDRGTALQQLDVVGLGVDLLGQLRLRELEAVLGAAVLDRVGDLAVEFEGGDDVVGAVDFGEALAFGGGGGGGGLEWGGGSVRGGGRRWGGKRGRGEEGRGLTAFPAANFFSVAMMAPERWAAFRAPLPRTTVSRWVLAPLPLVLEPIFVTVSQSSMVGGGVL